MAIARFPFFTFHRPREHGKARISGGPREGRGEMVGSKGESTRVRVEGRRGRSAEREQERAGVRVSERARGGGGGSWRGAETPVLITLLKFGPCLRREPPGPRQSTHCSPPYIRCASSSRLWRHPIHTLSFKPCCEMKVEFGGTAAR